MKINFDKHPNNVGYKPILDPNQKGVKRKPSIKMKEQEILGKNFEKKISQRLAHNFPAAILFDDVYFLTDYYNYNIKLYYSLQIDHILILPEGIFVIEDKYLSPKHFARISGSGRSKTWKCNTIGGKNINHVNGVHQNRWHGNFVEQLLQYLDIKAPVYLVTVIGGLPESSVYAEGRITDHMCTEDQIIDVINLIIEKSSSRIGLQQINSVIQKWQCNLPDIDKMHRIYLKRRKHNALPKLCNGLTIQY